MWDTGSVDGLTELTYTVTSLEIGVTYTFFIEARNEHGYGPFTSISLIISGLPPVEPEPPVLAIWTDNSGEAIFVTITWTRTDLSVISHQVYISCSDDITYAPDTDNCSGETDLINDIQTCTIPLTTLFNAPFNLEAGSEVFAYV